MDESQIRNEISQYVINELAHDQSIELSPDVELLMTGIVDSMGAVRLVGFIEQTWGVRVPPQDVTIENFGTVADIAAYVSVAIADIGANAPS